VSTGEPFRGNNAGADAVEIGLRLTGPGGDVELFEGGGAVMVEAYPLIACSRTWPFGGFGDQPMEVQAHRQFEDYRLGRAGRAENTWIISTVVGFRSAGTSPASPDRRQADASIPLEAPWIAWPTAAETDDVVTVTIRCTAVDAMSNQRVLAHTSLGPRPAVITLLQRSRPTAEPDQSGTAAATIDQKK